MIFTLNYLLHTSGIRPSKLSVEYDCAFGPELMLLVDRVFATLFGCGGARLRPTTKCAYITTLYQKKKLVEANKDQFLSFSLIIAE